jgi:hypothetical protein
VGSDFFLGTLPAEQCKIPDANEKQTDYYFFSRKDKKYPTGNRANRATTAGFWKATGRDKAIWTKVQQLIGMRKTLVFYEGRAPHGNKTDWIMHEFRLDDGPGMPAHDDGGWVVCRVFKKTKNFKMKTEERAVSYEGQFGLMPEIMSSPEILSGGGGGAAASYHPGFGPNNNPSMVPSSPACKQEMNLESSYNAVPAAACHDSFNALHLAQLAGMQHKLESSCNHVAAAMPLMNSSGFQAGLVGRGRRDTMGFFSEQYAALQETNHDSPGSCLFGPDAGARCNDNPEEGFLAYDDWGTLCDGKGGKDVFQRISTTTRAGADQSQQLAAAGVVDAAHQLRFQLKRQHSDHLFSSNCELDLWNFNQLCQK